MNYLEQKRLNEELLRECEGYRTWQDKPDGAYIQENDRFLNLNKIKRLIEAGANVKAKGYDDWTPLHYAVCGGNIELVKLLISAGAEVNAKNKWGTTPLHYAVDRNDVALAEYLISAGANINAKDNMGRSPLSLLLSDSVLISDKKLKIVKLLFKAGATE